MRPCLAGGESIVFKEGKSTLRTGTVAEGHCELPAAGPLGPLVLQRVAVSKGEKKGAPMA